jgi:hypothetical protein
MARRFSDWLVETVFYFGLLAMLALGTVAMMAHTHLCMVH